MKASRTLTAAALCAALCSSASAREYPDRTRPTRPAPARFRKPAAAWSMHVETLSRVMVAESHNPHDWRAIAWVLEHRRRNIGARSPGSVIRYSATLRRLTPRARVIHGPLRGFSPPLVRQYARAVSLARAWIRGRVSDPCPNATDWRGIHDRPRAWMVPVHCGPTDNVFGRRIARRS